VPGVLTLEEDSAVTDVSYLRRILFDGEVERVVEFTTEGVLDVVLPLPEWVNQVEEVHLTLTGTIPSERVLPPVGPEVATLPSSAVPVADLILDIDHAGAARLPSDAGLSELTGVRLPLGAGIDGAEVRVVIYEGTLQAPVSSVSAASSTPVALAPSAAATEGTWTTFEFPEPIALPAERIHWAVIAVSRGTVSWTLGQFATEPETIPLRRGLPTGPWHTLPTVVPAVHVGARIRQIGHATKEEPIAPLILDVIGAQSGGVLPVTPKPKGTSIVWTPTALPPSTPRPRLTPSGSGSSKSISMRITSRIIGRVTLSDVTIVATKLPA
jgi:hypothetical protein